MRSATSLQTPRRDARLLEGAATSESAGETRTLQGGRAPSTPGLVQSIQIRVDRGYRPRTLRAFANEPLRLVFRRLDGDPCAERVVFSSPQIEARLASRGNTTVDLPAQPPGIVRFTSGMGRYRGEIVIVERSVTGRDRRHGGAAAAGAIAATTLLATLVLFAEAGYVAVLLAIATFTTVAALGMIERPRHGHRSRARSAESSPTHPEA